MDSENGLDEKSVSPLKEELAFPTSWVDDFVRATEPLSSPELFRKWAGISAISGALERKVWVRTKKSNLYPNLYIVICAPPGVGKTEIINETRQMWLSLETHHIARSSETKASLIDSLNDAERKIVMLDQVPPVIAFNALLISSNELGVLLPAYDNEFMNTLTDLYDCKIYGERRRTNKLNIEIPNPCLNIIAGCTPGFMRETLPPGAWDQGFLSRVVIIYSGEMEKRSFFEETDMNEKLIEDLQARLKAFSEMYGKFTFTAEAAEFIDHWQLGSREPLPEHPRLMHYNTRRPAHLLKLAMIAAVATGADYRIEKLHLQIAMNWLFEAEYYMPDIFKAMATGGDSQVIEETFHHLYTLFMREGKKPIGAHRLIHFLQERTPAHNIMRILEVMERAKMIEQQMVKGLGIAYVPIRMRKM